eukprot:TRINITY_DN12718_c0_g1_i4.p1 TRINITY_DN12718_c0_g1~~TRINITY_DN12718_c0_g1_i4.p1  ORF type:complete len:138 (-),score=29.94 TRINITY_DN12718_c0_g1_i4:119-532(-)
MEALIGSYQHSKSENLDEYFGKMGVPWIARKMITSSSPSLEISQNGDEWTLLFKTPMKNNNMKFKFGEEFEETTPFGAKMKGKASFEDGKMILRAQNMDNNSVMYREFSATDEGLQIVMRSENHNVVAIRRFKKVSK